MFRLRNLRVLRAWSLCFVAAQLGVAQLNQNCVVAILNRTVQVSADGTWVLPNIPAGSVVRARATCVNNGVSTFGQSDLFTIRQNLMSGVPPITLGSTTAIPTSISVQAATTTLTKAGNTTQLTVTASYAGAPAQNVASASDTIYNISNPAVATVSATGLVTAVSSGTVIVQAVNEGRQGVLNIQVAIDGASNGGIPDTWIIANFCPNFSQGAACPQLTDASFPFQDPDHDGLTNLQEFQLGTDPNNPDTDGDGLTDGQEALLYHTNPLLISTDGSGIPDGVEVQSGTLGGSLASKLAGALSSLEVRPSSFVLTVNSLEGQSSQQLSVLGHLIDGKTTIDLTSTSTGTTYSSSDLTICNFGAPDGNVFAGSSGSCTITVTNAGFHAAAKGTVTGFTPIPLSYVSIPGFANSVAVNGNYAYVAAGAAGLQVVDVTDRTNPRIVAALPLSGNSNDIRLLGSTAYIAAGSAGLQAIDVSNPLIPVLRGTVATGATALSVVVSGTTAYVANTSNLVLVDVTNPAAMARLGVLPLNGVIQGVDVDPVRKLAAVAAGGNGVYVVDVANPIAPAMLSNLSNTSPNGSGSGADARALAIRGNYAFVADYLNSTVSVDITNPENPVLASAVSNFAIGGLLRDVAVSGHFALGAGDVQFPVAAAITDITDPTALGPRSPLVFPQRSEFGMGIAADGSYVYLSTVHGTAAKFGTTEDSRLYIGQYLEPQDNKGIPPTVSIVSPLSGATLVPGSTVPVIVSAGDDVAVAAVNLLVNGQVVFTATSAPYQFNYAVPAGVSSIAFGANAVDYGNNVGTAPSVAVSVVPDPGTTVTGKVVDGDGNSVSGATVTAFGQSSLSGNDGSFSIHAVPTTQGAITASARLVSGRTTRTGTSAAVPPATGGTTNVGNVILHGAFVVVAIEDRDLAPYTASVIDVSQSPPAVLTSLTLPKGLDNLLGPLGVSVTPDGSRALVSNPSQNAVIFIDLSTSPPSLKGTPLVVGNDFVESTAVTSDGRFAVTAGHVVASIDIVNQTVITTPIPGVPPGTAVAITPDHRTVLIVDNSDNEIWVLALSSQGVLTDTGQRITLNGAYPYQIAVSPSGNFALVGNRDSQDLSLLSIAASGGVTLSNTKFHAGGAPDFIFSPDGTKAYVALGSNVNTTNTTVLVWGLDANGNVLTTSTINVPRGTPSTFIGVPGLAISKDGSRLYVSDYNLGVVSIIDTTSNTVLGTVPLGIIEPTGIATTQ